MRLPIYSGSGGLRTLADGARSAYSQTRGIFDLAACLNIDICDRYRISRRRGVTRQVTLSSHSLCPVGDKYCLFVSGTDLNRLLPDLTSYITIATVTANRRLSYAVLDNIAYWANGIELGKVENGVNYSWNLATTVVSSNVTRIFYPPPPGRFLAYYRGRMYVADGQVIWYSEPFSPDVFALGDSFLSFESEIQMVRGVASGLFVSDAYETWFLAGKDPSGFDWNIVDNHPVLPYSDVGCVGAFRLDEGGMYRFLPGNKQEAAFWLTQEGVIFGSAEGAIHNLTEEKIDLLGPYASGAILLDNKMMVAQFDR